MSLLREVMLESKVQRELYLSAMEVIDMVSGTDDITNDMVADILEKIGVIHMPMYVLANDDYYKPVYESVGAYNIKQDIEEFFQTKQDFLNDESYYNKYKEAEKPLMGYRWSRLDLLSLDKLVKYTNLVEWGDQQTLLHIYNGMVNNKNIEYQGLPSISKEEILNFIDAQQGQRELANQELGNHQKTLITYKLFTPEQIACLLTNSNPLHNHNSDNYNVHLNMVSNAIDEKKLTYANDKDQILAEQVKVWLKNNSLIYKGFNDRLPTEQPTQIEELQKRIDELEKELNVFKEGSNDLREVIKVNFTDDEYRDIVELANQDGVSESEYVSNAVMKAIDTIYPFIKAFDLNDDENLSKARSKFLNYLKENKNSFEVFSMLADAEIFPHEYSQFSTNQELSIKDSAYCLIAVLKNLLLNPDIGAYHFKTDNNNSTNKPTQTGLANYIDEMKIFGIKKDNINILFQEANKKLKDIKKKS